ncbi:MAG: HD domain-containing phosphohydrolase [Pseudomonadota bacterium]
MDFNANNKLQMLSVSRLELGMYVAELDRPWSETPFQYEGFEIFSEAEIGALQQFCKVVFIDPAHVSTVGSTTIRTLHETATAVIESQRSRLHQLLTDTEPHDYPMDRRSRLDPKRVTDAFNHARTHVIQLHRSLTNGKQVDAQHCRNVIEPLVDCTLEDPDAAAWLTFINKDNPEKFDRRISTAVWAAIFARYLQLAPPVVLDIASGGLLLDLGFGRLSSSLRDHAGIFNARERLAMQSHVRLGNEMLQQINGVSDRVIQMLRQHHERIDGSGYPRRLRQGEIGPYGSFAAVVDCYDAMISETRYRTALSSAKAIRELNQLAGSHFPELHVHCFIQALGMFPSGSIVELSTGEVGIVLQQDPKHRLRPVLLMVRNEDKEALKRPYTLKLAGQQATPGKRGAVWIDRGHPFGTFGVYPQQYFS